MINSSENNNRNSNPSSPSSSLGDNLLFPVAGPSGVSSHRGPLPIAGPSSASSHSRPSHFPVAGPSRAKYDSDGGSSSDDSLVRKTNKQLFLELMNSPDLDPQSELAEYFERYRTSGLFKQSSSSVSDNEESDNKESDNKDAESSSSTPFSEKFSPMRNKKKRKSKMYPNLPSDESDLLSSESDIFNEKKPNLAKEIMREILDSGYEKLRKKGKPNYDIVPRKLDHSELHPDVVKEIENPVFDEEGLAIINYNPTDDFSRFIVCDLPNMPDIEDCMSDAIVEWLEKFDEQNDLQDRTHKNKDAVFNVLNAGLSEKMDNSFNLAKRCSLPNIAKSGEKNSKQIKGKKTLKVPIKCLNSKTGNKGARKCAKASLASSKAQRLKTTGRTPKKQGTSRVKLSHKSVKSPSKKTKTTFKCKSAQKFISSPQKSRNSLAKKGALKKSKENANLRSQKFITPSLKRNKTGLASKATLKQFKGDFKNKIERKIAPFSSTRARKISVSEITSMQSKSKIQALSKSSVTIRERKKLAAKIDSKLSGSITKNRTLEKSSEAKTGSVGLGNKIASKKSRDIMKNPTLPNMPAAKRRRKNLALNITSKQSKSDVKNQTLFKSLASKSKRKSLAIKSSNSKQPEGTFNQTLCKSFVTKRRKESSALQVQTKQSKHIGKRNSPAEFTTTPFNKKRTSLAKKNIKEFDKSSPQLSTSALCSKLSSTKKSKFSTCPTLPAKIEKISPKKVSVASQKQNKAQCKVTKLNKSVKPKTIKSKEKVLSVAKQKKHENSWEVKRRGLRSEKATCSTSRHMSSSNEKQLKSKKLSNLKQGLNLSKVDRPVNLRSKETEKSTVKLDRNPMLQVKRVLRMKRK